MPSFSPGPTAIGMESPAVSVAGSSRGGPGTAAKTLKPLSCASCRARKIKCDKASPCTACSRAGIECVFPARQRKVRGRHGGARAKNTEISSRLSKLESLVQRLEGAVPSELFELAMAGTQKPPAEERPPSPSPRCALRSDVGEEQLARMPAARTRDGTGTPRTSGDSEDRYLSSTFWKSLSDEVRSAWAPAGEWVENEDSWRMGWLTSYRLSVCASSTRRTRRKKTTSTVTHR